MKKNEKRDLGLERPGAEFVLKKVYAEGMMVVLFLIKYKYKYKGGDVYHSALIQNERCGEIFTKGETVVKHSQVKP